ncbi:MAG: T9SS type A sorting domain-containing protein, partial [Bacteroidota bacterium]
ESALTIDDDLICPPTMGNIYQPEQALSAFDGEQINGTWTLLITDSRRSQNGELTGWQIDYCLGTSMPTCDDGIQNGLETGVDCGGPDCPPCMEPTCDDGIQNGLETGVDCGGPDCPPCMVEMCDTPTGLFDSNNTGTSVTLNWTDVPAANDYTVQGRQQGVSAWQLTLTATTNSITITNNIVPGVTYEWRVRSNCDDDSSPYSEVASFTAGSSAGDLESRGATIGKALNAQVYPSPTQEVLNVLANQNIIELEIVDITGKIVHQMQVANDRMYQQINVAALAEGHYFLRLRTERGFEVLRFVKQ